MQDYCYGKDTVNVQEDHSDADTEEDNSDIEDLYGATNIKHKTKAKNNGRTKVLPKPALDTIQQHERSKSPCVS